MSVEIVILFIPSVKDLFKLIRTCKYLNVSLSSDSFIRNYYVKIFGVKMRNLRDVRSETEFCKFYIKNYVKMRLWIKSYNNYELYKDIKIIFEKHDKYSRFRTHLKVSILHFLCNYRPRGLILTCSRENYDHFIYGNFEKMVLRVIKRIGCPLRITSRRIIFRDGYQCFTCNRIQRRYKQCERCKGNVMKVREVIPQYFLEIEDDW